MFHIIIKRLKEPKSETPPTKKWLVTERTPKKERQTKKKKEKRQ